MGDLRYIDSPLSLVVPSHLAWLSCDQAAWQPCSDWLRHAGQRSAAARSRATRPHIINRGPPPVHAVNDLHAAVPQAHWSEGVVNCVLRPRRLVLGPAVAACEGFCAACTAHRLQSLHQSCRRITSLELLSILWHWLCLAAVSLTASLQVDYLTAVVRTWNTKHHGNKSCRRK